MADYVYSVRVSFDSILVKNSGDWIGKGEIYFIANVGGRKSGRSPIFKAGDNETINLAGKGFFWEFKVLGGPPTIPVEIECWDEDLVWDDKLGKISTSVSGPWVPRQIKTPANSGKFELTWSISVTVVSVTKAGVAVVSRQYGGGTYKSTLKAPNVALVTLTEVLGLHKPGHDSRVSPPPDTTRGSGYLPGYISDDDKGRIFINRLPDDTWKKGTQYIELTAVVEPSTVKLPQGAKIVWSFVDPDDPTNEPPNVHKDAGMILDPNDYSSGSKTGAAADDNDPRGKKKASPKFEQIDAKYALSGSETLIDIPTRTSKVRFHVSDIAGDNYKVKATVKADPSIDYIFGAETGVMTVWNRIDVEYVKMASAAELPVNDISKHYDIACAQVDISLKRVVSGTSDIPYMDESDGDKADARCDTYATKASGEFTKEGEKGWFFIVAANRLLKAKKAKILYEGDAEARDNVVRLPTGTTLSAAPSVVRVFDSSKIGGMSTPKPNDRSIHFKFNVKSKSGQDLKIDTHDFHEVEDPDNSFLEADLSHYGFAKGTKVPVQVLSAGDEARIRGGQATNPLEVNGKTFFRGQLVVFTQASDPSEYIWVLCHELCHAFDNAHKCGNWDWVNQTPRKACCMCYWMFFVLDDASPRAPIQWTQNRPGPDLCARHIVRMRDFHLEDNPGLGWG